ncbi:hypothetical protein L228DRAFT_247491 [Xylona heveae TC161]|uniref:Uncharacterized protein n=1 Tax=Xylona heveae (strain CBS 132557 / TC161) TaxID=1328760 RepID=A0A165H644_XYLHT|nr:hypothetical protein L228DRAFT_247491 [Xylona heveae TC161]KZF23041.1 hypothetical protein L228DRAFT_247491 [Xylona heveae TC161]
MLMRCSSLEARHSDLFQASPSEEAPPTLSYPMLRQIVLACASLYATTASQLASVRDLPLPAAKASTSMIGLQPRIDRVNEVQMEQLQEIAHLRRKSAALIERWYKLMILAGNECWSDWEHRTAQVEREIRREEVRQAGDGAI